MGDLDGDGRSEVVVATREGYVRAFRTSGRAAANADAWHWHLNDRNSGLHGEDTRPPAAARAVRRRGRALSFRAPGDDWHAGRAARFEVFRSRGRVVQGRRGRRVVSVPAAADGGERVTVRLPRSRGRWRYGVRAVDDAGNAGPLRVR